MSRAAPAGPAVPAPPDARLPDGYAVRLDPRTRRTEDGAALLGGSPLRLLRLAPRARDLLAGGRLTVTDAATAALAARLLDAAAAVPEPAGPAPGPDDVTVVVPVRDRTAGVARLLAALRADPATAGVRVLVVDDGSADPAALAAVAAAGGAEVLRHGRSEGPAAARNTGLRAATTEAVALLDSDCVPVAGWLAALLPHLADPRLAVVAPRVTALPAGDPGWVTPYETAVSALDMGPSPAPVAPLTGLSYVPSAALLARRTALGEGFDAGMRVAEDVDLVWRLAAAGWRVRYEPAARVAHDHPSSTAAWLRRRALYGTGAAPLATRHGDAVAPVVVSPWSAAAVALALAGGRPGRLAAAGTLGVAAARLAGRLAAPDRTAPYGLAAALVLRGTASAGRTLARSATRHHWPVGVAAALVSARARRGLAVVAAADAVLAWWPHRTEVGLLRFAAARRLEDLAYGAGLWAGALRSRDARALLPARPPPG
ncbi:mycofactocin system glycosyltransferase [Geodermatophilus bullaregiensis]|uniref:mycofactocin biosynthesis glycosyltransferase MftF n=1 Tax=Geodermatophilus bullaregiensis TaxID=1564160 RepID=UPI00195DFAA5|nr:mycofactocin biosynthesis glycosyltransferase MftF [Geodermatophilus bullaregiensis]MBM7806422.1 mycofactocin system glycosyltransferase [Geodermatophilus bullaregiensis]